MCLRGDRLALAGVQVNRLQTDGGTGGLQLGGATVGHVIKSVAGEVDVSVDQGHVLEGRGEGSAALPAGMRERVRRLGAASRSYRG